VRSGDAYGLSGRGISYRVSIRARP